MKIVGGIRGEGGLTDPAFLVEESEDHALSVSWILYSRKGRLSDIYNSLKACKKKHRKHDPLIHRIINAITVVDPGG